MVMHERKTILTLDKSQVSVSDNNANVRSTVVDITVPRTLAYKIRHGTPLIMFLYTKELFDGTGAAQTITVAENMLDSPSQSDQQEVVVHVDDALVTNYTVDHANNQLTSTGGFFASGTDNVEVWYLWRSLSQKDVVTVRVADANQEKFQPLMNRTIENWHSVNQYQVQERQEIRNEVVLPHKTHLLIELNSDVVADMADADSPAYMELAVIEMAMESVDPSEFVKFTES